MSQCGKTNKIYSLFNANLNKRQQMLSDYMTLQLTIKSTSCGKGYRSPIGEKKCRQNCIENRHQSDDDLIITGLSTLSPVQFKMDKKNEK